MSYKCIRDNIINYNITDHSVLFSENTVLGSVIRDILNMKYHCKYSNQSFLNTNQIDVMLEHIYVDIWSLFVNILIIVSLGRGGGGAHDLESPTSHIYLTQSPTSHIFLNF